MGVMLRKLLVSSIGASVLFLLPSQSSGQSTEADLLPLYLAEKIEKKGLAQDLDCQVLFNHIVETLDPAYKNQKKSIVKRPPNTADPKVASSYLAHVAYSSVVKSYLSGAGLPDDFVPGPLLSAVREGSVDESDFNSILQETYGECLPRFLMAAGQHEAEKGLDAK